jgi:hypothetical protein
MGRTGNGSDLGQWTTSNSDNQQWTMTTVGSSSNARQISPEVSANESEELGINLYPNPFAKTFTLEVPSSGEQLQITILDAMGKEVETITHSGASTKLLLGAALKPGLYIIRVSGVNGSQSFKVLKE